MTQNRTQTQNLMFRPQLQAVWRGSTCVWVSSSATPMTMAISTPRARLLTRFHIAEDFQSCRLLFAAMILLRCPLVMGCVCTTLPTNHNVPGKMYQGQKCTRVLNEPGYKMINTVIHFIYWNQLGTLVHLLLGNKCTRVQSLEMMMLFIGTETLVTQLSNARLQAC